MKNRLIVRIVSAGLVVGTTMMVACEPDPLAITNSNNPDVTRAYASPGNVEGIVSKLFQQMYNGQYGTPDDIWTQAENMALESHSTLGNFGMGTRAAIPRSLIDNSIGNTVSAGNFQDFDALERNGKSAGNAIIAINSFKTAGFSTGSPARDARAKSFAYFNLAYAMGQLSLLYDSVAVIDPSKGVDYLAPLAASSAANKASLDYLDSAIAISNSADASNGANGWPIPVDWVSAPSGAGPTLVEWRQLLRSYKARFRADFARTPAERAAVDWATVIADATNGIQADFNVQATSSGGWSAAVVGQLRASSSWSQMTPMILGMGDTSVVGDPLGSYRDFIAKPLNSRSAFLQRTPDKRWPSGATRDAQITASGGTSKAGPPSGTIIYFRDRPVGEDNTGEPWGTWYYDNHRFWGIPSNGGNGPFAVYPRAENDMLAAEGYLRTNNVAAAAALIDRYRLRAGLPSVAGITSLTASVPGGQACVPNVPQPPSYTTTACGNIFEAMKWEKRSETNLAGYSEWFLDSRGWGDLPAGTPLEWPAPYQELFARYGSAHGTYTTTKVAVKGTYGF